MPTPTPMLWRSRTPDQGEIIRPAGCRHQPPDQQNCSKIECCASDPMGDRHHHCQHRAVDLQMRRQRPLILRTGVRHQSLPSVDMNRQTHRCTAEMQFTLRRAVQLSKSFLCRICPQHIKQSPLILASKPNSPAPAARRRQSRRRCARETRHRAHPVSPW